MHFDIVSQLPISEVLEEFTLRLRERDEVVLQAPPGAGKTTVVPLTLLDQEWLGGRKILLLEPRRIAARAAAARMAQLLGEEVGQTVGYRAEAAVVFDRPGAGQLVSGGLDWSHPSRAGYYGRYGALISEVLPLEDCLLEDPIEVMFTGGVARMRELVRLLESGPDAARYAVSFVEYAWRDFVLVDVLGAGVTKGTTLAEWAREMGLPRPAVMAVGDNHNDREMLEFAGTGVVMGNSVPELLDGRFPVTGTNDEAGLAQAINRFVLGGGRRD